MLVSLRYLISRWNLSLIIVMTLAIGIGTTTAVYSLIHGFLLRPLPYGNPEQLMKLDTFAVKSPGNSLGLSFLDADDIRMRCRLIAGIGSYSIERVNLVSGSGAQTIEIAKISSGLFALLGVKPILGREFSPEENQPGGPILKAILSERIWRERFGADPMVIGKTVRTAMSSYEVVGVMPAGFGFPERSDLWVTEESALALRGTSRTKEKRQYRWSTGAIARLAPGASVAAAQAELNPVSEWIAKTFPLENKEVRHRLQDMREAEVGPMKPYLLLLGAAVVLVLMVCCFNLASLLLAQATRRQHEFTVRAALGAQARDVLRQLLAESLLLSVVGGLLGVAMAQVLLKLLPQLIPVELPFWIRWDLNGQVLGVTALITLACAILFGLAPLKLSTNVNLQDALRIGSRGAARTSKLRSALVVAEIVLSVVLLVSAGLIVESFYKLMKTETGFRRESVVTFTLSPYRPGEDKVRIKTVTAYYEQVLNRLREIPGVISVGGTDNFPFTGNRKPDRATLNIEAKGDSEEAKAVRAQANFIDVSPGYFKTMRIPIREGRDFTSQDDLTRGWVMILSEHAAKALFGNRSAIGQQVRAGNPGNWDPYATVIGVVGNVKYHAAEGGQGLEFYYPYKQYGWGTATIAVRAAGSTAGLENQIRSAVGRIDAETPVNEIKPLETLVEDTLWQPRLWSVLLGVFAGTALLLAMLGIYGLISFNVNVRMREIGIRAAIGATPGSLLWLVSREGLQLIGVGVLVALPSCLGIAVLIQGLLFETEAFHWPLFVGASLGLVVVGFLASLVPALRAARLDPVKAMQID
jgi:predicted permease